MIRRLLTAAAAATAVLALAACDGHTDAYHCGIAADARPEVGTLTHSERTSLGTYCEFSTGARASVSLDDSHTITWL